MAQGIRELVTKPDKLRVISGTHRVEEKNFFPLTFTHVLR